jgi:hypothetical protein
MPVDSLGKPLRERVGLEPAAAVDVPACTNWSEVPLAAVPCGWLSDGPTGAVESGRAVVGPATVGAPGAMTGAGAGTGAGAVSLVADTGASAVEAPGSEAGAVCALPASAVVASGAGAGAASAEAAGDGLGDGWLTSGTVTGKPGTGTGPAPPNTSACATPPRSALLPDINATSRAPLLTVRRGLAMVMRSNRWGD